jgi:hypothetical protein
LVTAPARCVRAATEAQGLSYPSAENIASMTT